MAKTAPFWQQKTYMQRNILLEERFCCDRNVGIDFVFDLFLKSLFNKYRGNQCRMGHWVTLKANKIQTDLGKKRILQSLKTHAGISFIPICMEILRMLNEIGFLSNRDSGKTLKEVLREGRILGFASDIQSPSPSCLQHLLNLDHLVPCRDG